MQPKGYRTAERRHACRYRIKHLHHISLRPRKRCAQQAIALHDGDGQQHCICALCTRRSIRADRCARYVRPVKRKRAHGMTVCQRKARQKDLTLIAADDRQSQALIHTKTSSASFYA